MDQKVFYSEVTLKVQWLNLSLAFMLPNFSYNNRKMFLKAFWQTRFREKSKYIFKHFILQSVVLKTCTPILFPILKNSSPWVMANRKTVVIFLGDPKMELRPPPCAKMWTPPIFNEFIQWVRTFTLGLPKYTSSPFFHQRM